MLAWDDGMVDAIQGRCRDAGVGPRHDHRAGGIYRAPRIVPVGPTHAVDAGSGGVACGIPANKLNVLDQDWEAAFVEKCPGCFLAILADS